MKNSALAKKATIAGCPRAAVKMQTESAMKAMESPAKAMTKSPMEKELVGKQHNLPAELKAKIEASPARAMESPMKDEGGKKKRRVPRSVRRKMKNRPTNIHTDSRSTVTKESPLGVEPTVTQKTNTKKDGKWVRTTTIKADNPEAKEKYDYLVKEGKFPSMQAQLDYEKEKKPYASTVTKQATKKGKKTFTAAEGDPKYMTKTKTKKDGTVKTKRKRYRKNVFKGQPGVGSL